MTFEELCHALKINATSTPDANLSAIKEWCWQNVSQDISYDDKDMGKQFDDYKELARHYLDEFLPLIPADITEHVTQFSDLNALQYAAKQGYDRFISSTPLPHEQINRPNAHGMTALHLAASFGRLHSLKELLDKGADANLRNSTGKLAMHCALTRSIDSNSLTDNRYDIVHTLESSFPDSLNISDDSGENSAHLMSKFGFHRLISELVESESPLLAQKNNFGKYPVMLAILNGHLNVVRELLTLNEASTLTDTEGRTPLHYAAKYSDPQMLEACLEHTNANVTDNMGNSPIQLAISSGNLEKLQLLIDKGADLSLCNVMGQSLIHTAVIENKPAVLQWLLENTNLDVNQLDRSNKTPLDYAADGNAFYLSPSLKQYLFNKGALNSDAMNLSP